MEELRFLETPVLLGKEFLGARAGSVSTGEWVFISELHLITCNYGLTAITYKIAIAKDCMLRFGLTSLVPRPYARARERVSLRKSKSLGPLQNLKASYEIAKRRLLEYCGSETIYILLCESSSFTILWLSLCLVLSGPLQHLEVLLIYTYVLY